jgi:hypothetical protein
LMQKGGFIWKRLLLLKQDLRCRILCRNIFAAIARY